MNFLIISIILLCLNFVVSDDVCSSQNSCKCVLQNKAVIDLSSVGTVIFPRFYEVLFNSSCTETELYSYNPCFPFDSPDKPVKAKDGHTPCLEASACVKVPGKGDGQPPEEHAIGLQSTATFGSDDNGKQFYITYSVPTSKRKLQVILNCSSDDVPNLTLEEPDCESSSSETPIKLTLMSKCACPNGCKSAIPKPEPKGMSTGSKLLIAFFTIFLAYLFIGIVWNYCNGSQGMELVPNIEFWNDLPTLMMEGVVFTFTCCGRQSSYGAV